MKHAILAIGATVILAAGAHAASPIKVKTENGTVIAGSNSYRSLYTYDKDQVGVPTCYDACAEKWPPHLAEYWDSPRPPFGTVKRSDGKMQWTKDGKPLYFSVLDEKKGDTKGDGVDGLWSIARPQE